MSHGSVTSATKAKASSHSHSHKGKSESKDKKKSETAKTPATKAAKDGAAQVTAGGPTGSDPTIEQLKQVLTAIVELLQSRGQTDQIQAVMESITKQAASGGGAAATAAAAPAAASVSPETTQFNELLGAPGFISS